MGNWLSATCPSGQKIVSVDFASYGTSTGTCGNYKTSSCHASSSKSIVENACLGKNSCKVATLHTIFGDPCPGVGKNLKYQVTCATGMYEIVSKSDKI